MVTFSVTPVNLSESTKVEDDSELVGSHREVWSWREESNLQPAVYKTAALPIELRQPMIAFRFAQYQ